MPALPGAGQPGQRLAALTPDQLRGEWRRLFRTAPPARLSRDLLMRAVAHKLQEAAHGGLQPAAKRRLAGMAAMLAADGEVGTAPAIRLKPGATLVREWHGRSHHVTVLEDGFEHQGRRYPSLSKLAQAITGAHWSGPRFFGLARAPKRFAAKPGGQEIGQGADGRMAADAAA